MVDLKVKIQCKVDPIIIKTIWQEIDRMQCHDASCKRKFTITTVVLTTKAQRHYIQAFSFRRKFPGAKKSFLNYEKGLHVTIQGNIELYN